MAASRRTAPCGAGRGAQAVREGGGVGRGGAAGDPGDDGAQQGDAEGGAEFVRGLGDAGGGTGLPRRDAGEDDVGRDGERQPGSGADDQQGGAEEEVARVRAQGQQREQGESGGAEPARDGDADRPAARDGAGESGGGGAEGLGEFAQACLERGAALDELEELGEEEDAPGEPEHGEQVRQHGAGEAPVPEEPHVQQRLGQDELPADEGVQAGRAEEARTGRAGCRGRARRAA